MYIRTVKKKYVASYEGIHVHCLHRNISKTRSGSQLSVYIPVISLEIDTLSFLKFAPY